MPATLSPPPDAAPPPAGPAEAGPHWGRFLAAIAALGPDELARRWDDAQAVLRENGVTYNVYADPTGRDRAWKLDPVPLVVSTADAALITRGLAQRARLLELVTADIYGPQTVLKEGLVPSELVFANPGFLRPLHGVPVPGGRYLHLVAANLGRDAGGQWRVLGDRTQAPSGAGYALENRIVTARTLPEAFRDCRADRLALFFRGLRDRLTALAPPRPGGPRVVLLTPGPYNETYFEHAYLARYLGLTLVEGGDLTVRDDRVYLKVLGGLQPVDVIFRRLDDDFCDPLELRPDSYLGVPGLVNAVRAGTVAVANALGAGVLESPALLGYLPVLARHFLGEELVLSAARTWWLGDPAQRADAMRDLSAVVVKPRFLAARLEPVVLGELPAARRADWLARIDRRPAEFVAQERLPLSTVPVLAGNEMLSRRCVLRGYAAAGPGDAYDVMPGGLTRVSATPDSAVVTMQGGGGSKDTWFLTDGPVSDVTLLPAPDAPVELTRAGGDLPSRAADNLFWLGRHAERADGVARLLRGVVVRLTERPGLAEVPELTALLNVFARLAGWTGRTPDAEAKSAVYDPARSGGLAASLAALNRVAGGVRDRMSLDMWRALSEVCRPVDPHGLDGSRLAGARGPGGVTSRHEPTLSDALEHLNRTVLALAAVAGLAADGMTRTDAWRFLDIGRRVERSLHLLTLLNTTLATPAFPEPPVLEALLEVADAGMTYRRRYPGRVRADAVLDLLVLDDTSPRSLVSQLASLAGSVDALPRPARQPGLAPDQRAALDVWNRVRVAAPDQLAAVRGGERPHLQQLTRDVAAALPVLSDTLTEQYLTHQPASRHLGGG